MNILIVDDDELLIDKIYKGVNWSEIGISNVFTAKSVKEATKKLKQFKVEIVITDIEMPQGNGLELLEWISLNKTGIKCIILSSYAKFSYAQKAIKFDAHEYLLKPIRNTELTQILARIMKEIDSEENRRDIQKEEFWEKVLAEDIEKCPKKEKIINEFEYANAIFTICILKIFNYEENWEATKGKNQLNLIIKSTLKEYLKRKNIVNETILRIGEFEWMFIFKDIKEYKKLSNDLLEYIDYLNDKFKIRPYIYIKSSCDFNEFSKECSKTTKLIKLFVVDEKRLIFLDKCELYDSKEIGISFESYSEGVLFSKEIKLIKKEIIDKIEKSYIRYRTSTLKFDKIRTSLYELLIGYLNYEGRHIEDLFENKKFQKLYDLSKYSLCYMKEFVEYIFNKIEGNYKNNKNEKSRVETIKKYINKNYNKDLSSGSFALLSIKTI